MSRTKGFGGVLALGAALTMFASAPRAADAAPHTFGPGAYHSFVMNWSPDTAPLCAAFQSKADWDKVMHPAPTMGSNGPYSPPDDFWAKKAIVMIARVVNAGDTSHVFDLSHVRNGKRVTEIDYSFHATPPASSTEKWYLAVEVPKPIGGKVEFREDGKVVCTLDLTGGTWVSPMPGTGQ